MNGFKATMRWLCVTAIEYSVAMTVKLPLLMNQFEMVAETVGTKYGSKCETKASGWVADQKFFSKLL